MTGAAMLVALTACGSFNGPQPAPEGGDSAGELAGELAAAAAVETAAPNLLLIIADDVGVDKVGAYADDASPSYRAEAAYLPDTPTLDALAAAGVRFTDAWANPLCSPTRAALFTGLYGFRTGMVSAVNEDNPLSLDPAEGYATGLFGKWHLGENAPPTSWGRRERWEDHLDEEIAHPLHPISHGWGAFYGTIDGALDARDPGNDYNNWIALEGAAQSSGGGPVAVASLEHEHATFRTAERALAWIQEQDTPWMATLAFHAVHTPLDIPPEGCSYRPAGAPPPVDSEPGQIEEMVECMDRTVGELLAALPDLDNTLVVFMGDNGTASRYAEQEYASDGGKGTAYEGGVRVPLIVADGGAVRAVMEGGAPPVGGFVAGEGRTEGTPVHVMDLFATFSEVAGADGASGADSVSLLPLLEGCPGERGVVFTESSLADGTGKLALRIGGWKLMVIIREERPGGAVCRSDYLLFDLMSDRFEATDVSAQHPEIMEQLLDQLDALERSGDPWFAVDDC
jgi:arylsulfatase B